MLCIKPPLPDELQKREMGTSPYFDRIVFKESSAADQIFEERSGDIFQTNAKESYVDVHLQSPCPDDGIVRAIVGSSNEQQTKISVQLESVSSTAGSFEDLLEPDTPVDKCDCPCQPPQYVAELGLNSVRIKSTVELDDILQKVDLEHLWSVSFIRQRHSYSRLSADRELFEVLTARLGVFPKFKDFVLLFGTKQEEHEMTPPPLRFWPQAPVERSLELGWTLSFECAYCLRYVELNHRNAARPWSIRQMAVYQRYRHVKKTSTWILVSASPKTETCIDGYIKNIADLQDVDPFELHVLFLEVAFSTWRPYVVYLAQRISQRIDQFSVASIDNGQPMESVDFEARQVLNDMEDELIDALSVLDSTEDTIDALHKNHERYCIGSYRQPDVYGLGANVPLYNALHQMRTEVAVNRKKINALSAKLKGAIKLLSSLLNLENGISLRRLTQEAAEESGNMRRLTEKSTQDAATVKMLTVITIIYLPATAISNFFSTEFVSLNGENNVVKLSANAWLFAALVLPLTLITLIIWWLWMLSQGRVTVKESVSKVSPLTRISTHWRVFTNMSSQNH